MTDRTIYLVRHGRILLPDDEKRFIGQTDFPLNEEGVRQAEALKKKLADVVITSIHTSDLRRTKQTAQILSEGRSISVFEWKDLRELSLGTWEGLTFEEIRQRFPAEFEARGKDIFNYRIPGGESFADCRTRVVGSFNDILTKSDGNTLIVGHSGVNRLILCHVLGMPSAKLFSINQDYGCLNIIENRDNCFRVRAINITDALR
ncbi:MAG TPA: alpha-ribazole phosphatase [Dissulfurispiraceae bacterium]|nr:alpha-ribazole phosphatase [Dissulfurispiraceae bacterium]